MNLLARLLLASLILIVPATSYAVIERSGNSTDPEVSELTQCTSNTTCANGPNGVNGVCSDVHFDGDDVTLKICSRCNVSGAASCTGEGVTCNGTTGSCVSNLSQSCQTDEECAAARGGNTDTVRHLCVPIQGTTQKVCVSRAVAPAGSGGAPCQTDADCENATCYPYDEENQEAGGFCLANADYDGSDGLVNAFAARSFEELITKILDLVVQLGATLLVLALVWVGFLFVNAQGKEDQIKKAREALFWCVIGGLMLLGAQAISLAIKGFVGAL